MEKNNEFDLVGSKIEEGLFRYKLSFPIDKILDNFSFLSGSFYMCDVDGECKYIQVFTVEGMAYGNEKDEEDSKFFIFFIGSQPLSKQEMDEILEKMKKENEDGDNNKNSEIKYKDKEVELID